MTTTSQLRAFSVINPWGQCIASGRKTVENRTCQTHYRGPVLIHTSLRGFDERALMNGFVLEALADAPGQSWHRGRVIATATLTDCHRCDGGCSPWAQPGSWHWVLSGVEPLALPVPAKGALGLWVPDAQTVAAAWAGVSV